MTGFLVFIIFSIIISIKKDKDAKNYLLNENFVKWESNMAI